jgi:hypothetical protein
VPDLLGDDVARAPDRFLLGGGQVLEDQPIFVRESVLSWI